MTTSKEVRDAIKAARARLIDDLLPLVDAINTDAGGDVRNATSDLFAAWSKLYKEEGRP